MTRPPPPCIILISIRFATWFLDISGEEYSHQVAPLMLSAGIIVLASVSYDDIIQLWNVLTFAKDESDTEKEK